MKRIDVEFLQECLDEVRCEEFVTILTEENPDDILDKLREMGATEVELSNIEVVRR